MAIQSSGYVFQNIQLSNNTKPHLTTVLAMDYQMHLPSSKKYLF